MSNEIYSILLLVFAGVDQHGRGIYYRNILDCCVKIVRVEGVGGLFKGFVPICWKYAPHTIVTLTTWEWMKKCRDNQTFG